MSFVFGRIVGFWFTVSSHWMLAESSIAAYFQYVSPSLKGKNKSVGTLLYFKTELKILGPVCSWTHSENIAQCLAGTESGPFTLMWQASDGCLAKNGKLSPWVCSHPPVTSSPFRFILYTLSHTSHPELT